MNDLKEAFRYTPSLGILAELKVWNFVWSIGTYTEKIFSGVQIGSVDEESTKSDEEYDDLAMQDMQENGYWSDDDEEAKDKVMPGSRDRNLDNFHRTKSETLSEPCSYSSILLEKNEMRKPSNVKMRRRSLSIPAFRKHGAFMDGPILSAAPKG